MTAASQHPDLHELVDRLDPAQAAAVQAVIVQLVHAQDAGTTGRPATPRRLSFAGSLAAEPDLAERADDILAEVVRNAG